MKAQHAKSAGDRAIKKYHNRAEFRAKIQSLMALTPESIMRRMGVRMVFIKDSRTHQKIQAKLAWRNRRLEQLGVKVVVK